MKRKSQQGVALVITLILLSVITFMAVTFLVVSRREGAQVNTLTQQSNAKFAADAAAEQAKALIMAQMLATTNGFNFGLLVSTNFVAPGYINTPIGVATNINNVAYTYPNGNPLSAADQRQMLNNLLILPRAPVFVVTNAFVANLSNDFRFYLDLNRNGVYDTNGVVRETDASGNPVFTTETGDPEWIGILNHPDQRHSASNLFVARYCFIALPIGNSLDLNYIHNQAGQLGPRTGIDGGYFRNQGVGSWEINLAGFLNALNTNFWPYFWATPNTPGLVIGSTAFNDAAAIVQYRYNGSYNSLSTFKALYGLAPNGNLQAPTLFGNGYIDGYAAGPVMTGVYPALPYTQATRDGNETWSGSDNTNAFFTTQDLFNNVPPPSTGPTSQSFTNRLTLAGRTYSPPAQPNTVTNSYNRYTFYRLLSQLSFGSSAEPAPAPYTSKMNLNYNNVGIFSNGVFVTLSETNFVPWTPVGFFTNAADRMLRAYFPNPITNVVVNGSVTLTNVFFLSMTNIPIYPVNFYTPAVHRILQLAANMYDASTNKIGTVTNASSIDYPSVFAPFFNYNITNGVSTNIYISGYVEVTNANQITPQPTPINVQSAPLDLRRTVDLQRVFTFGRPFAANIYGVPYVIGAKPLTPHFNRFATTPVIDMWRKLEYVKASGGNPGQTNIQYQIGISNVFGVDCWYPSTNTVNYGHTVKFYATNDFSVYLTNNLTTLNGSNQTTLGTILFPPINAVVGFINSSVPGLSSAWVGSGISLTNGPASAIPASFKVPLYDNAVIQPDAILRLNPAQLLASNVVTTNLAFQNTGPGYFIPHWGLNITNRMRMIMTVIDLTGNERIIDYVQLGGLGQLAGPDTYDDINGDLMNTQPTLWSTAAVNPKGNQAPLGIYTQISMAEGAVPTTSALWQSVVPNSPVNTVNDGITKFKTFLSDPSQTSAQVPFVVATKFQKVYGWSANDPLVHYMVSDLVDSSLSTNVHTLVINFAGDALANSNGIIGGLRALNSNRSQPWGFTSQSLPKISPNQLAYKDPLIAYSDLWQFPTNKFPNVGWLGMVHRGTPWQTVYLKSSPVDTATWASWTGDLLGNYFGTNYPPDSMMMQPTNDWLLMDLFTTSPNENASRGQLSVNQTNLAAWAAILDGVNVLVNSTNGLTSRFIDPADTNTFVAPGVNTVQYIVNSINAERQTINTNVQPAQFNFPGGVFTSAGQILSVPQLTVASPYINPNNTANLSDAVYERIPQQIMSLLRLGSPKYVIFAYGQALKPAEHSIVQSGPFFGMCTNYQITGEVATRTVVRFENAPIPARAPTAPRAVIESFNVLGPE